MYLNYKFTSKYLEIIVQLKKNFDFEMIISSQEVAKIVYRIPKTLLMVPHRDILYDCSK